MTAVIPATPQSTACRWCGMLHGPACPALKAIEFFENGMVKRVEFKTAANHGPQLYPVIPSPAWHGWSPAAIPGVYWQGALS